jgi:TetR/AcrR family transcriptional regulator, repressor for uid operon
MRKVDPVRHEQKKREILDAASSCFAQDGFRGASIADICAAAKISAGHLYHYFDSKEAIIEAMAAIGLEHAEQGFHRLMASDNVIEALIDEIRQVKSAGHCDRHQLHMDMLAESGRNPAMAAILRAHSARLQHLLATLLRDAQARGQVDASLNADIAAAILLNTIESAVSLTIRDQKADVDASLDVLAILITRFLTPPAIPTCVAG